jgi:hypothetical protein
MLPLGIVTAIIGAIRVSGPSWARAFIGRAKETRATAEIELMSSTSTEVCEVFNGRGIVRAIGTPKLSQFILLPKCYREDDSCGIYTLETALNCQPPVLVGDRFNVQVNGASGTLRGNQSLIQRPRTRRHDVHGPSSHISAAAQIPVEEVVSYGL